MSVNVAAPVVVVVALVAVLAVVVFCNSKEGYRDPIYIDPLMYQRDIYPRSNGSIYDKNFNIFSGHVYYSPIN